VATSRPYKVTTKEVVGKTVVAEDHVNIQLDIPPILPREQTGEILAGALKERKFVEGEDGKLVRERDGVTVEVDPDGGSLTVSCEAEKQLPPPSNPSPCGCRAAARLKEEQSAHNDLQRKVTQRLEGAITRLGCEMEGVVHKVTAEALKRKARQLGEIKQITEDPKTGSMTIVVEV
jgi:hypothetical protein